MIYYVEDDSGIRELVVYTLNQSGLQAKGFGDGQELWSACESKKPDLILLDIMLPHQDGLSILKNLKSSPTFGDIPVIMVTARGTEYDKVLGLDSGADDYIAKPFGMMELVARVKARLRDSSKGKNSKILTKGKITLDILKHEVKVDGTPVALTLKEFSLLELLMKNPGVVFTREQLLERNWDYSYDGGTRTIDVHVQTLRSKLGECASMIQTVRGVGYKLGA